MGGRGVIPPSAALLPDGRRLHLQHGPIDLVIGADGPEAEVAAAYAQATEAFPAILPRLVDELTALRRPAGPDSVVFGPVARRMLAAVQPFAQDFITPMAAVAGAVAEEVLVALVRGRDLSRAYVNNGGDIALHLTRGNEFRIGMVADLDCPGIDAVARVSAEQPVRGIATSGAGGRSFSLGIADAVTVLAATAAQADAAATVIANAVTIDHPGILRSPARSLSPDSDLGDRPVIVSVPVLSPDEIDLALAAGAEIAGSLLRRGLIRSACLALQGRARVVAPVAADSSLPFAATRGA